MNHEGTKEAAAIFRCLAREASPDTYVNIMAQYHPDYRVGEIARDGTPRYASVGREPQSRELEEACRAAAGAGL